MTFDEMWAELEKEDPELFEKVDHLTELYNKYRMQGYSDRKAWRLIRKEIKNDQRTKRETHR